jgi:hypothetical protein
MSEESFQPAPIATWNPVNGVWETSQMNLLCGHSVPYSAPFPVSGKMVTMPDGLVCVLPMQVHLIVDSESSFLESGGGGEESDLMPTPTLGHIRNYNEPIDDYLGRRQDFINGKVKGMPGVSLGVAIRMEQEGIELLRSPKASEGQGGALGEAEASRRGNTVGIRDQVMDLVASQGFKVSRKQVNE